MVCQCNTNEPNPKIKKYESVSLARNSLHCQLELNKPHFQCEEYHLWLWSLGFYYLPRPRGGGGYSIYPWVGRCGAAPHTLTLFKTNITDFPTHFKTEFRFLIPCLGHLTQFKTKIDKSIPWLRQKMVNSIPCSRQKSRKTYPGWPHVPIKPL